MVWEVPMEYASIALGVVAIIISFVPIVPMQLAGVVVGIVGIVQSRRARKRDYRKDLPCTIGFVSSIAGLVLCAATPVLWVIFAIARGIMG